MKIKKLTNQLTLLLASSFFFCISALFSLSGDMFIMKNPFISVECLRLRRAAPVPPLDYWYFWLPVRSECLL